MKAISVILFLSFLISCNQQRVEIEHTSVDSVTIEGSTICVWIEGEYVSYNTDTTKFHYDLLYMDEEGRINVLHGVEENTLGVSTLPDIDTTMYKSIGKPYKHFK